MDLHGDEPVEGAGGGGRDQGESEVSRDRATRGGMVVLVIGVAAVLLLAFLLLGEPARGA